MTHLYAWLMHFRHFPLQHVCAYVMNRYIAGDLSPLVLPLWIPSQIICYHQDFDFDMLEFYAGNGNLTACMRAAGYRTGSLDLKYKSSNRDRTYKTNPMDILSTSGFWFLGGFVEINGCINMCWTGWHGTLESKQIEFIGNDLLISGISFFLFFWDVGMNLP